MKNKHAIFALAAALLLSACGSRVESSTPSIVSEPSTPSVPSEPSVVVTHTVTLTQGEHYTIAPVSGSGSAIEVEEGSSFKFTVTAHDNYLIKEVKANNTTLISSNGTYTIPRVNEDTVVTVEVERDVVSITLPTGTGFVVEAVSGYNPDRIEKGGVFEFTVTPTAHYVILSVKADGIEVTPVEGIYTLTNVVSSVSISVDAEEESHSLTLTEGSLYSIRVVTEGVDLTKISYSTEVQIEVTAIAGHHIVAVKLNGVALTGEAGVYTIKNLEADSVVTVDAEIDIFTVTWEESSVYTITAVDGFDKTRIEKGSNFEFTLAVIEHYHVVSVKANNDVLTEVDGKYTISDISDHIAITVDAIEDTYALSIQEGRFYDINVLSAGVDLSSVKYSEEVRFQINPKNEHCHILSVKLNGEEISATDGVYTVKNQLADASVTIEASIDTYSVHLPTGEHYTVAPVEGYDASEVEYGSDFKFTVTPEEGYRVIGVMTAGDYLTPVDGVYTIESITQNRAIAVETEVIHDHVYDPSTAECTVCGKINLISTIKDQTKLSVETPEGVTVPAPYGEMHKYDLGSEHYFNGTSIFSAFDITGLQSISFYISNLGTSSNGTCYQFFVHDADVNVSATRNSGLAGGISAGIVATQTSNGVWSLETNAVDANGRKGWIDTSKDYTPQDVALVYENVSTLADLFLFSSWNTSIYLSDIRAVAKPTQNVGFPAANASKVTDEAPEGVAVPSKLGTMHKYEQGAGNYLDGLRIFEDVDISSWNNFKFYISNKGVDGSGNEQWLYIADENMSASPKRTGVIKGGTGTIYGGRNADGEWELTTDITDQYGRTGFADTTSWAPSTTPVNVGAANTLNDLLHFTSWAHNFYMSDIIVY